MVGVVGGLGLMFVDFFCMKEVNVDIKEYEFKEGVCKLVIFIFMLGGMVY